MTLKNIISLLLEEIKFRLEDFATKPIKEMTQQEKNDLARDIAINIKGGYVCGKCKKNFTMPSELDFHHDKTTFANLKKDEVKKYRKDTAWEIIKQSEEGRDIKLLCPSCHRTVHKLEDEVRTKHTSKKEDDKDLLFTKEELKKLDKQSETTVKSKDKLAGLFEKVLTKEDFDGFVEALRKKDFRIVNLPEKFNNHLIEMLNSEKGKKEFYKFIKNKEEDILDSDLNYDEEEEKLNELKKDVAKIRAILQYHHPKNTYDVFLKDKNRIKANIKNMSK
jgi:hypothetical protein